jgi:hypothetical protein
VKPFPIDEPENFLPATIVVDPSGQAYVAINASPLNPAGAPNQVFALDRDGNVAWTSSFAGPVAGLTLGRDGQLWLVGQPNLVDAGSGETVVMALGSTGNAVTTLPVPGSVSPFGVGAAYDAMALASDGSFLLESTSQNGPQSGVAHMAPDGLLQWVWPGPGVDGAYQLVPPLIVGPADGVLASSSGELLQLDAAGNQLWDEDLGAQVAAVDAQGYVVAITSAGSGNPLSLVRLDPLGEAVQTVPLGSPQVNAIQVALAGDGTTVILLANEVSSPGLTKATVQIVAVDASRQTRWTTPLDVSLDYDPATLATHYGLFVDGAGTVVVTAGAITGIDLATGSILWTLQPPSSRSCLRPAVLGAGGSILASQCDGTVFLARDP